MKYSKYKQCTAPWFQEIPQDWEITKIGRIASKIGSGKTPRGGAQTYTESGVLFIRSQNVHNEGLCLDDIAFIEEAVDEDMSDTRVYRGDILLNITGASLGRCSLVTDDIGPANVNQHVCIIRPDGSQVNPAFLWLAVVSSATENQILSQENGSSREGLNFQQVRNLLVTLPPIAEQGNIVGFLGNRLSKINTLIRKKEELIEKLQEKRSALISRTVTRGLPSDAAKAAGLNPHPKMKDSGIEWLGDIPQHWGIRPIKHLCSLIRDGTHLPPDRVVDGVPLLSVRNIVNGHFVTRDDDSLISEEDYEELCRSFVVETNDVLLAIVGATLGKVAIAPKMGEFHIQRSLAVFRPLSSKADYRFFAAWLRSNEFQSLLWISLSFSAQPGIYLSALKEFPIIIPPLPEQMAIANFLDRETTKIDQMIKKVKAAIEKLTEYRSAFITAAVTGKIDVRNYSRDYSDARSAH